jgi:hypothetical protein
MRPYPEELLRALQAGVQAHFAPELRSTYAQAQLAFSMLLFMVAQRDYDTAVPDLIDANRSLRDILAETRDALPRIEGDAASSARHALRELPPAAPTLRLSDLRAENDALRAALAALAPVIEPAADDPALAPLRDVRAKVFGYLTQDARRRIVPILSA